jgi:hypothetical protein
VQQGLVCTELTKHLHASPRWRLRHNLTEPVLLLLLL